MWHAIGQVKARDNSGWLAALADEIGKPINELNLSSIPSLSVRYISSLYFTLSSLTTVGFRNIAPSTNEDKIFVIFVMIMGGKRAFKVEFTLTYRWKNK